MVRIDCDRLSACGVGRLGLAVDVDLDAGGAARAVVGDEQVRPDAGLHLSSCVDDLERRLPATGVTR